MNMAILTDFNNVFAATEGETVHRKAWQSNKASFTTGADFIRPDGSIDVTPLNVDRELAAHIDAHLPHNPIRQDDEE